MIFSMSLCDTINNKKVNLILIVNNFILLKFRYHFYWYFKYNKNYLSYTKSKFILLSIKALISRKTGFFIYLDNII